MTEQSSLTFYYEVKPDVLAAWKGSMFHEVTVAGDLFGIEMFYGDPYETLGWVVNHAIHDLIRPGVHFVYCA